MVNLVDKGVGNHFRGPGHNLVYFVAFGFVENLFCHFKQKVFHRLDPFALYKHEAGCEVGAVLEVADDTPSQTGLANPGQAQQLDEALAGTNVLDKIEHFPASADQLVHLRWDLL
jgi:hypothetical protein